jgi:hypothetical protein
MAGVSPTQRSNALYRKHGYQCGIVEKFNSNIGPHGIRQDLWGAVDIVAVAEGHTVGVQACAASGHGSHVTKLAAEPRMFAMFDAGWDVVVLSWKKPGPNNRRWSWRHTLMTPELMTVERPEPIPHTSVPLTGP